MPAVAKTWLFDRMNWVIKIYPTLTRGRDKGWWTITTTSHLLHIHTSMSATEARRTDTLPCSTEHRLRGQTNLQDRSESSSHIWAVTALDVAGTQQSPSAAEADMCVLCLDPMDGPKKSHFELGCRHQDVSRTCLRMGNTDPVSFVKQRSLHTFKREDLRH